MDEDLPILSVYVGHVPDRPQFTETVQEIPVVPGHGFMDVCEPDGHDRCGDAQRIAGIDTCRCFSRMRMLI